MRDVMSASVKRKTAACALCRKRKVKCDARSWPCGPCRKTGATCVGGDVADGPGCHAAPRSLVIWLQEEISKLERKNDIDRETRDPGTGVSAAPTLDKPARHGNTPKVPLTQVISDGMVFPWLGFSQRVPLPPFVLLSEARLPSIEDHPARPQRATSISSMEPEQVDPLKSIPKHVADFLLEVYITRTMPVYPIFHEHWLRSCHATVIHQAPGHDIAVNLAPYNVFTISLVMAVSLSTAARSKQAKANEMAFKLFHHAILHIKDCLTNDFAGLQALLLLHTYAIMNPAAANVYFLAGYIMQACIDQGLHQEDFELDHADLLAQDMRRRVFWTAWEFDVSCSAGFARPIALLPEDITTGFPSELEDSAIHSGYFDTEKQRTKFVCGRVRAFRLIEVEVISVLFHDNKTPLATQSLEDWMEDVCMRIHRWKVEVHTAASTNETPCLAALWEEMTLFADIAAPLIVATLFRPCPRVKAPTTSNLLKAFEASIEVARGYVRQANMGFGSLKYTFQPCHHVFSCAMVFLHTIRECSFDLVSLYSLEEMESFMSSFSTFFTLTAERWPASLTCLDEYQRLLEPLRQNFQVTLQPERFAGQVKMDELDGYLTQQDAWLSTGESLDHVNMFEFVTDMVDPDLWSVGESPPLDWDRYFNFGSL